MNKFNRPVSRILLVFVAGLLLPGCALRSLFGNVIIVANIEDEVNEIITTIFTDSTAAVCLEPGGFGFYECIYILDGEIITSTLYLLSEFGITGVLIDPVILQIPADVEAVTATYDDGAGGGAQPLVQTLTTSFYVTPTEIISAEAGQTFLILELPPSVIATLPSGDPNLAPEFTYALAFTRTQDISLPIDPVTVKIMLAGKAVVNGYTYYVPLVPCVSDFALIPSLEIPQSLTPVDLEPAIGDLIALGGEVVCDHKAYFYPFDPILPLSVYLPVIIR